MRRIELVGLLLVASLGAQLGVSALAGTTAQPGSAPHAARRSSVHIPLAPRQRVGPPRPMKVHAPPGISRALPGNLPGNAPRIDGTAGLHTAASRRGAASLGGPFGLAGRRPSLASAAAINGTTQPQRAPR
jgi:hypothetical protein